MTSLRKYSGYLLASDCFARPRHSRINIRLLPPAFVERHSSASRQLRQDLVRAMPPGDDLLPLLAEFFDAQMHLIAGLQENGGRLLAEAHSRRSSGDEQVARVKSHELAYIGNQLPHGKNHALGIAGLHAPTIQIQEHLEILRISDFLRRHEPGTHREIGR